MLVHAIILDEIKKYQCRSSLHKENDIHFYSCCRGNEHEIGLKKTIESVSDCKWIDVLTYDKYDPTPFIKDKDNVFITFLTGAEPREKIINELVEINPLKFMNPSDYILLLESGFTVDNVAKRLVYYTDVMKKKVSMVAPSEGIRAIIHGNTFRYLCGFSVKNELDPESRDQSIISKISIMAKNHNQEHLIVPSMDEFYERTNAAIT